MIEGRSRVPGAAVAPVLPIPVRATETMKLRDRCSRDVSFSALAKLLAGQRMTVD